MEILKIASIGLVSSVIILFLNEENKEYSILIAIVTGIIILALSLNYISPVISVINEYSSRSGINLAHLKAIFKIIATSYIAQFASEICTDYGSSSIAGKIELSARIMIIYFSLPIIISLFQYLGEIL